MMNLGMRYVWNMHESCVSKIHPFSGHAQARYRDRHEAMLWPLASAAAFLGDSRAFSPRFTADVVTVRS